MAIYFEARLRRLVQLNKTIFRSKQHAFVYRLLRRCLFTKADSDYEVFLHTHDL